MKNCSFPIIDIFAGPGGLGEGFSSLHTLKGVPAFKTLVSIERETNAHKTLLLRHFFRLFKRNQVPNEYYDYISGKIKLEELKSKYPLQWDEASSSALQISLGNETHKEVEKIIKSRLGNTKKWVLVGGPPCQAYSLVGRSRMMGSPEFEKDERHFLYQEYLKIIIDHKPPVFVMENVKGLLSAKVKGEPVIKRIIKDLSNPTKALEGKNNGLSYRLYSLSEAGEVNKDIDPSSFIVRAEEYGVPQARHRMFIVGIRSDISITPDVLQKTKAPTVKQIIGGMPRLRSGLSAREDDTESWKKLVSKVMGKSWYRNIEKRDSDFSDLLKHYIADPDRLPSYRSSQKYTPPRVMRDWYVDEKLKSLVSHESRAHMDSDIHRYFFAAAYAEIMNVSPKIVDFPDELLPNHRNIQDAKIGKMFSDRFRVQVANRYSTTITSHISKDGHYFIHYDPSQSRSLTVREAARLQTFPDNYHFEGNRTAQYHQVGNAVPPYLAMQIADVIKNVLNMIPDCDG
ncbi:DNA cytosine methyltransferase [Dyadobacter sp. Leaf189]|uniref:DNA cytosine methyltransferase n=1 Tax=Dyadobacter sp. Leaf189 TaxID=1736295 RepID=UPI0006F7F942|nr:DNA cytosine methyltransferase [Dyadobacter sp. Leaf189]KQS32738.1 cytosine methyltransferase [Dyadobacter sp. Leaf189]